MNTFVQIKAFLCFLIGHRWSSETMHPNDTAKMERICSRCGRREGLVVMEFDKPARWVRF